jgi:hypothetical protein
MGGARKFKTYFQLVVPRAPMQTAMAITAATATTNVPTPIPSTLPFDDATEVSADTPTATQSSAKPRTRRVKVDIPAKADMFGLPNLSPPEPQVSWEAGLAPLPSYLKDAWRAEIERCVPA